MFLLIIIQLTVHYNSVNSTKCYVCYYIPDCKFKLRSTVPIARPWKFTYYNNPFLFDKFLYVFFNLWTLLFCVSYSLLNFINKHYLTQECIYAGMWSYGSWIAQSHRILKNTHWVDLFVWIYLFRPMCTHFQITWSRYF